MNLTRRDFLALSAAITAGTSYDSSASAQQPGSITRLNILFILADDLGYGDLSCYGRPDYKTPVLDDLAARGIKLTQAYANSSTCTPTRVALITGRYQNRLPVGLYDPLPGGAPAGLPPQHPTLPGLLRTAGYRTALVGKWHLGFLPAFSPLKSGYDEFFGFFGGGMTYFTHKSGPPRGVPTAHGLYEGEARVEREGYSTDLFADRAIEVVSRADAKPFFVSLHFNAPHWPWEGPQDRGKATTIREMAHYEGGSPRAFRSMVESLDAAVGRVLKALEWARRADDTIIVFTSDNGGERYSYHWPFRGAKGYLWEGGIRVPAIVVWPGVLTPGKVLSQLAMSMDWLPTLLSAGGAKPDPAYPSDGVDLLPVLRGQVPPFERTVFWRTQDMMVARKGDWKYVRWDTGETLANLAADETENANFKMQNAGMFEELKRAYTDWDKQMLPIPAEVRRGSWESQVNRARDLELMPRQ
jgi:arylsulfatase A-like enzyme